jgi:hypothetical protein
VLYPAATLGQLVGDFESYRDTLRSKTTILGRASGERLFVPATSGSRYFADGQKRIQNRLRKRLGAAWSQGGVLVTLTYDPKLTSRVSAWAAVGKDRREFTNKLWLFRRRHKMGKRPLGYLSVLEVQPGTGYPHVHMIFPGIRWLAPYDAITACWGHGHTDVRLKDNMGPTNYLCKYIAKMEHWQPEFLAYLHTFGVRMYSVGTRYFLPRPFVVCRSGRQVYLPVSPWFYVAQYASSSAESPPLDSLPVPV